MMRVLLVEDDPAIADIYALKLRMDGFAVSVADDQPAADTCFWQERPAVVCLDEWLPSGSGTELAERFASAGALVVLFTNDQRSYENPPASVCRALLKARTSPAQLSAAVSELVGPTTANA